MWVSTAGWVAAPVDEVVGRGPDRSSLERWSPLLAGVTGDDGGDGPRVGAAGRAELVSPGGRRVPVRWRVLRRVRDTVHLEVVDDVGDRLVLRSSFSPWHGGTAVELGIEGERIGGRRLRPRTLAPALDRAIAAIERRAVPTVRRSVGRRDGLVPSVAGLPAPR